MIINGAKVRISEQITKGKTFFLCYFERKRLRAKLKGTKYYQDISDKSLDNFCQKEIPHCFSWKRISLISINLDHELDLMIN